MKGALWICPQCGNTFVTRNMPHSCGVFDLDALFARSIPSVRQTFDTFRAMVESLGDVKTVPQKTRVSFQTRTRFAGGVPKRDYFDATFVFFARNDHPRFWKIEDYGKWQVHRVRLASPSDVDEEVRAWLVEAKRYGDQVGPMDPQGSEQPSIETQ